LYAVLRELKAGEITDNEAIKHLERSPYWVWTAMDPKSKLLMVVDVSPRVTVCGPLSYRAGPPMTMDHGHQWIG
jgi:hypothetical protein